MKVSVESIKIAESVTVGESIVSKELMEESRKYGTDAEAFEAALRFVEDAYIGEVAEQLRAGMNGRKPIEPYWWNAITPAKTWRKQTRESAEKVKGVEYVERGLPKYRQALPNKYVSPKQQIIKAMKAGIAIEDGMSREMLRKALNASVTPRSDQELAEQYARNLVKKVNNGRGVDIEKIEDILNCKFCL